MPRNRTNRQNPVLDFHAGRISALPPPDREPSRFAAHGQVQNHRLSAVRLSGPTCCGRGPSAVRGQYRDAPFHACTRSNTPATSRHCAAEPCKVDLESPRKARGAHLESTTKFRRKRAPVAELESSANPQPGKAALPSARFPACGFWRLSSRQMVLLSSNSSASRACKGAVTHVSSPHDEWKTHTSQRGHADRLDHRPVWSLPDRMCQPVFVLNCPRNYRRAAQIFFTTDEHGWTRILQPLSVFISVHPWLT